MKNRVINTVLVPHKNAHCHQRAEISPPLHLYTRFSIGTLVKLESKNWQYGINNTEKIQGPGRLALFLLVQRHRQRFIA